MAISKVIFEYLTLALEYASAGIIVFGILFSVVFAVIKLVKKSENDKIYHSFRVMVGRCILLGLELLIARRYYKVPCFTVDPAECRAPGNYCFSAYLP